MTIEEGCELLASKWFGCHDSLGLLSALQEMGAVKFDVSKRQQLLDQASRYQIGKLIEVSSSNLGDACRLICDLAVELQKSGEK